MRLGDLRKLAPARRAALTQEFFAWLLARNFFGDAEMQCLFAALAG
jgi:hypothetical protein